MIVKTRPELVLQQEDQQRGPALLALTVRARGALVGAVKGGTTLRLR